MDKAILFRSLDNLNLENLMKFKNSLNQRSKKFFNALLMTLFLVLFNSDFQKLTDICHSNFFTFLFKNLLKLNSLFIVTSSNVIFVLVSILLTINCSKVNKDLGNAGF